MEISEGIKQAGMRAKYDPSKVGVTRKIKENARYMG
jgi:hypothetical protein